MLLASILLHFFDKSNKHVPVSPIGLLALTDSSSSVGCMRIQPMPSLLQSVFKNVGFVESNLARTGEDVIHIFKSSNS